mmetsp:Transcript_64132/g.187665  ORF Transcript_64132/g.187665 Transcript_64132/m.187665 type:complete len:206 (+) Transcript_64132:2020-2637(+)
MSAPSGNLRPRSTNSQLVPFLVAVLCHTRRRLLCRAMASRIGEDSSGSSAEPSAAPRFSPCLEGKRPRLSMGFQLLLPSWAGVTATWARARNCRVLSAALPSSSDAAPIAALATYHSAVASGGVANSGRSSAASRSCGGLGWWRDTATCSWMRRTRAPIHTSARRGGSHRIALGGPKHFARRTRGCHSMKRESVPEMGYGPCKHI